MNCVVDGVDLVLEACNQDHLAGIVSRDMLKDVENLDIKTKLPGYVKGGMNLDYLYEISLNE